MIRQLETYFIAILFFIIPVTYLTASGNNDGVAIKLHELSMRVIVISPTIVRVSVTPNNFQDKPSLTILPLNEKVEWKKNELDKTIEISTDSLILEINKTSGEISFFNKDHRKILESVKPDKADFTNAVVENENVFHVKQGFILTKDEALFGLGQYEDPIMNYRGHDILISEANRTAVNPFIISTNGYGLLWDNYSMSKFHDGNDGTYFWSEVADQVDYYFVYGPTLDNVVFGYRELTGQAPMLGKWAYGYWQSKERYKTAKELVGVLKEYRQRKIPIDNIVQDWLYWGDMKHFSGMTWDSIRYPNPEKMINSIHTLNAHLLISIWPAFGPETEIYREMEKDNFLFKPIHWGGGGRVYDTWNPVARNIYWKYIKKGLFDKGVDAFWMDGTEPEFRSTDDRYNTRLSLINAGNNYLGTNARYLNTFSLETARGVYNHWREVSNSKRVFILTRSSFTGQQHYAAATWSGDTFASWDALKVQIAAGINFCMSGLPYWTNDIGAFVTRFNFPRGVKDDAYKELYVRWFQFGTFCPLFRSHGTDTPREIWQFGNKGSWAYDALVKADNLRYHLIPYIYSLAWKVTNQGYTIMRGLPMDFPNDKKVYSIGNEFMFGSSILVHPVTKAIYHQPEFNGYGITPDHFYSPDGEEHGAELRIFRGNNFDKLVLLRKFESSQVWSGCLPTEFDSNYSLKINGNILTESKGNYKFFIYSDAGVRMWVNNNLIIDKRNNKNPQRFEANINLDGNKKYEFKIYYQHTGKNNSMLTQFTWIVPHKDDHPNKVSVYLPKGKLWYDFWTGDTSAGGETLDVNVPIDKIPLFVPAGSVIPYGPEIHFAEQKSSEPIEIRIYEGENGSFQIYEDENDNYDYEKGIYSTIPFEWNNESKTLTIGDRRGEFPGMLRDRIFNIVLVKENHGVGVDNTARPDRTINYSGKKLSIKF